MKHLSQDKVKEVLNQLEYTKNLRVLYACEVSDEAWGFPGGIHYYNIRFIYIRTKEWYLSIDNKKDTIETMSDNIELNGWDIRKALRRFRNSDTLLFEWIQSPIIYLDPINIKSKLLELSNHYFSLQIGLAYYVEQVDSFLKHYEEEGSIPIKKYFNLLRYLFAAMWISRFGEVPPMEFYQLTNVMNTVDNGVNLLNKIKEQITFQQEISVTLDNALVSFFKNELRECKEIKADLPIIKPNTECLNLIFRRLLKKHREPNHINIYKQAS